MIREGFIRISLQLDGLPNENFLDVIGVLMIVLAIGFVLGNMYANYASRLRTIVLARARRSVGTQSVGSTMRSIGAQSQCTYKWNYAAPRFQVLPKTADGVFDVTYSSPLAMDYIVY